MVDHNPAQLFNALTEFAPPSGAEYIAALRAAGYTDVQICEDYMEFVQQAPTKEAFMTALRNRIEQVKQG